MELPTWIVLGHAHASGLWPRAARCGSCPMMDSLEVSGAWSPTSLEPSSSSCSFQVNCWHGTNARLFWLVGWLDHRVKTSKVNYCQASLIALRENTWPTSKIDCLFFFENLVAHCKNNQKSNTSASYGKPLSQSRGPIIDSIRFFCFTWLWLQSFQNRIESSDSLAKKQVTPFMISASVLLSGQAGMRRTGTIDLDWLDSSKEKKENLRFSSSFAWNHLLDELFRFCLPPSGCPQP